MRKRKLIKVFAVIPDDFELSVQYHETRETAENEAKYFFKGQASVSEMQQFQDVIDRKGMQTARYGHKVR